MTMKEMTGLDHLLTLRQMLRDDMDDNPEHYVSQLMTRDTAESVLRHIQPAIDILEAKKAADDFIVSDKGRLAREVSDKLKESFTKKITSQTTGPFTPYGLNMPDIDEFRVSEDDSNT